MTDTNKQSDPQGNLQLRTLAVPADSNPAGDIFGGWVLSQMDIAGAIAASDEAQGRVATVAVEAMKFHRPVHIGDVLCVYAQIHRIGTTSIAVQLEAWALRERIGKREMVTEGIFTYVALGEDGKPRAVQHE